jgi:hypothetical protein
MLNVCGNCGIALCFSGGKTNFLFCEVSRTDMGPTHRIAGSSPTVHRLERYADLYFYLAPQLIMNGAILPIPYIRFHEVHRDKFSLMSVTLHSSARVCCSDYRKVKICS